MRPNINLYPIGGRIGQKYQTPFLKKEWGFVFIILRIEEKGIEAFLASVN